MIEGPLRRIEDPAARGEKPVSGVFIVGIRGPVFSGEVDPDKEEDLRPVVVVPESEIPTGARILNDPKEVIVHIRHDPPKPTPIILGS